MHEVWQVGFGFFVGVTCPGLMLVVPVQPVDVEEVGGNQRIGWVRIGRS